LNGAPADDEASVQIRLLGGFELRVEGRTADRLRTRKTEGLLAWLALHRGREFSRSALVERFWPDEDEAAARRKLRLALHSIRQEVGEALAAERDLVALRDAWVDVLDLEAPGGDILPHHDFPWLAEMRAEHALRGEKRLRRVAARQLEAGEWEAATETLYTLIESDPYEPHWYESLHRVLLARGRPGEARSLAAIARARLAADCPSVLTASAPSGTGLRRTFVGRSRILASLSEALLGGREPAAAILHGPGGIGKTRIAQELAGLAKREEIETRYVHLVGLHDLGSVRQAVRDALRSLRPNGADGDDFDALPSTLLVLDNGEQLSEAAIQWLRSLLSDGSPLRLLMTTQAPPRDFPADLYAVPALSLPVGADLDAVLRSEAAQLFAMEAEIELDIATAPSVAAICRKLGGVPLAIRHVAARLEETTMGALLESLDSFRWTGDRAARDTDPRHRSVATCVRWSLSLTSETQREALRRLAQFADGFRMEAAVGIGIPETEMADLVRLNWVVKRYGEDAHEILPPFRRVLLGDASADEADAFRRRLIAYLVERIHADMLVRYGSLVDFLTSHARDLALLFEQELEAGRFETAETLLAGLCHIKIRRNDIVGAQGDVARFFAKVPETLHDDFPNAWSHYGSLAYFRHDLDGAEQGYRRAVAGHDVRLRGVALSNLGLVAMRRGHFAVAIEHLRASLEEPGLSLRSRTARRINLAESYLACGRGDEAEAIALADLAVLEEDPDVRVLRALTLLLLAEVATVGDRLSEARDWAERAQTLLRSQNERLRIAEAGALLAFLAGARGDREALREELLRLLDGGEYGPNFVLGFGMGLWAIGERRLAEPFLRGVPWPDVGVWAQRRRPEEAEEALGGLLHCRADEWRLRAENVMKRW
jgi:tetratricopeptide (TPR) repeat protein